MSDLDQPFATIVAACEPLVKAGAFVIQKWTCAGCKARVSASNVNVMTENGHCQNCNHVTDLVANGCGFTLILTTKPTTAAEIEEHLGMSKPQGDQRWQ